MQEYIKYIIISIITLLLDVSWIYINISNYSNSVLKIQNKPLMVNIYYAIIAYLLVIFSIIFVVIPFITSKIEKKDNLLNKLYKSFIYGGVVGFFIYSIYNFTSLAIYKDYDLIVGIKDTLWGTTLYTIVSFIYLLL